MKSQRIIAVLLLLNFGLFVGILGYFLRLQLGSPLAGGASIPEHPAEFSAGPTPSIIEKTVVVTNEFQWAQLESEEYKERMGLLSNAMSDLNEREKAIFQARRLRDDPATLEELAQEYNVSRERIRQIEVRAFEKVQEAVQQAARAKLREQA